MGENRARVFFGTELRRMRDEAKLTGKELADTLGCTPQWVSTMESGRKISEQSAHDLDTYFKTGGHFHRLWELALEVDLQISLPPGFAEYAEREKRATSARVYSALLVNGLFQSPEYARSVICADRVSGTEELVEQRMARQTMLLRDPPPFAWLTINEPVLHQVIGSRAVMKGQLEHLLELQERPNIMINVIPQNVGYHAGLGGSFTILGCDGSDLAYSESAGVGTLIERPDKVVGFGLRWDLLRGHALPVTESQNLMRTIMEGL
ncbi:helix-turn-helix domain-containing protein [Actinomadura litoris]|uniref:helix-turn-helix domain-containing protein n=1 Tax=Actinomadura litoris TaxID=2678616 RepID=UPI001FA7D23A|nr:helix-turn-helix transcriptional regulator [Actinomadura litoris]